MGMELEITAKFITKKAKRDFFDEALLRKALRVEDRSGVIQLARKLRRALVESCKESMPAEPGEIYRAGISTRFPLNALRGNQIP